MRSAKAMKQTLLTSLIGVLTIHLVGPLLVLGWFYAQQSTLAEQFCENQDRPELHCDGQCFLARKLEAYYGAASESSAPEPIPTFLPLGCPEVFAYVLQAPEKPFQGCGLSFTWPAPWVQRIFHPPRHS